MSQSSVGTEKTKLERSKRRFQLLHCPYTITNQNEILSPPSLPSFDFELQSQLPTSAVYELLDFLLSQLKLPRQLVSSLH